ncbi:hypothetical protein F5B21DRAFT_490595 [Xylaria acuta]|nr:hypothetical protein F5B21DRAFT_490595 [Xylaria acuta]
MAFGGDIEMDDVMADDELPPITDSDSETYSSDEEQVDSAPRKEAFGFVSDEEGVDLVSDKESMGVVSSEGEDEEEHSTIRPKIPFTKRLNPFVRPKDEKWQEIENYFFSLLRTPGVSIDDILEGTFDDHEITLITPQSGPPDLVEWQRRNARRYYDNLETRFKGATDTLAFKLTCLYFGHQVEPLRMGTMPFLLPPDPDPLDANKAAVKADPLAFLNKYNNEEKFIYDKNILNLRGGGASGWAAMKKEENANLYADHPLLAWDPPNLEKLEQKKKQKKVMADKAIQEVPPKGDEMDFHWTSEPTVKHELVEDVNWISGPTPKKGKGDAKEKQPVSFLKTKPVNPPTNNPVLPAGQLRIYGWQGSMNTSLNYVDFVGTVDRLISNWQRVDRSICVEVWRTSPIRFVQNAFGTLRHAVYNPPASDPVWKLVHRYFGEGDSHRYACFIRAGDEGEATDEKRPGGYQPLSTERGVIRIEDSIKKEVAYMRVPKKLIPQHKSHQFSMEYMLAMQVLFTTAAPHAWVLYQHGYIGAAYQYLDPPGGLWEQVIDEQSEWSPLPTISFTLKSLERAVVPVIVPGVFTSRKLPELDRKDFKLTKSTQDSTGLSKVYKAVELSLNNVNLKRECSGFEVWCPGTDFKYVTRQPTRVAFSGNITNLKTLQGWQGLLGSGVVPDEGFALVVRPTYKTYRLQKVDGDKAKVDLQLNEYDLAHFKAFVHNRIDRYYNPMDSSQVIILSAINQESFQTELIIHRNTTEEQWQWIRRNIVEPELIVSIDDLGNEWSILQNARWGPRYATANNFGSASTKQSKSAPGPSCGTTGVTENLSTPLPDASSSKTGQTSYTNQEPLDKLFQYSSNTIDEATRMQLLRDRTFTSVNSIFTNPLKPVMPLHGPPLESIIRTGPSMPGVSIAMLTPTEVLRLQREVHSLRFQLMDRTRECPYADCDRYFTFADSDSLDKHIREDHNVLRCFLCDKNQHLLPYYNADQIKEHFASEHVDDLLKAYGQGPREAVDEERLCDFFFSCGVVTTRMNQQQLDEHMKTHDDTPENSDSDVSKEDSLLGSVKPEPIESDTDLDLTDLEYDPTPLPHPGSKGKKSEKEFDLSLIPPFVPEATPSDTSSSDSGLSLDPIDILIEKPEPWTTSQKVKLSSEAFGPSWTEKKNKKKKEKETVKPPTPGTISQKVKLSSEAFGPDPAEKKKNTVKATKSPKQQTMPTPGLSDGTKSPAVQQKQVPVVGPKTGPGADADEAKFAALRKINKNPGTWQENLAFIKERMDEYVALGGKLPSDDWPASVKKGGGGSSSKAAKSPTNPGGGSGGSSKKKNIANTPGVEALLAGLAAQVIGGDITEEEEEEGDGDGGKKKKLKHKHKRKRDADVGSGSDAYEYSERSAVSDPPANLAADAPPSPKKQRSDRGGGGKKARTPTVITRTGRAVKPSRAAREAAEEGFFPSSSSSDSSLSSLSSLDSSRSSGSEESSEFEYEA